MKQRFLMKVIEDKKNETIIEGLEKKIKDHEASLEKKDFLLQTMEGSLAEAQAEVAKLNDKLLQKSESFEQEKRNFDAKLEAEIKKFESAKIIKRASGQMLELRHPMRATAETTLQLSGS
jgi:molecular chaperone GrpE (heat shock protein)